MVRAYGAGFSLFACRPQYTLRLLIGIIAPAAGLSAQGNISNFDTGGWSRRQLPGPRRAHRQRLRLDHDPSAQTDAQPALVRGIPVRLDRGGTGAVLPSDGIEIPVGPDVPTAVNERRRSDRALADVIHVEQLKRGAGTQHERLSVIIREEDLAVHRHR